jgi:hypothetical protein
VARRGPAHRLGCATEKVCGGSATPRCCCTGWGSRSVIWTGSNRAGRPVTVLRPSMRAPESRRRTAYARRCCCADGDPSSTRSSTQPHCATAPRREHKAQPLSQQRQTKHVTTHKPTQRRPDRSTSARSLRKPSDTTQPPSSTNPHVADELTCFSNPELAKVKYTLPQRFPGKRNHRLRYGLSGGPTT